MRYFLTLTFSVLFAFSTLGQEKVALKLGLNFTTLTTKEGSSSVTDPSATKLHVGAFFNHHLTREIAISPEIMYFGMGNNEHTAHYLSVPVMGKYFLGPNLNVHGGPQLNVLLGARDEEGNEVSGYRETNIAGAFGMEGYLGSLGLTGRYVFSLTDMDGSDADITVNANTFQLSIIYFFDGRR